MAGGPIGVTGATGNIGGRVARHLGTAGVAQRLIVRDPDRAPDLDGAAVAVADYGDGASAEAALADLDVVFMVSAAESPTRLEEHHTFVDAAAAAGVQHLVYLSFVNAAPDATFTLARQHWATEEHIRRSGLAWTFVRDNLYQDFFPFMVDDDGVIRGPAGDGRVAAVAQDDIAECIAAVLRRSSDHRGEVYSLTGPEALTLHEVAAVLSEVTHDEVTYQPETIEQAHASRASYDAADWQVEAWVTTYTAIAEGELAEVTDDVEHLAGHPPRSLRDVLGGAVRP